MNRARLLIVGTAAALAITVAGLGFVLASAHSHSRSELQHNFIRRDATAAGLFSGLLSALTHSDSVPIELRGNRVTDGDLRSMFTQQSAGPLQVAVFDGSGRTLASLATAAHVPTMPAAEEHVIVTRAIDGGSFIGDVAGPANDPVIGIATAYPTVHGIRVEVLTYPLGLISSILPNYLRTIASGGAVAFLLDDDDHVVGTTVPSIVPGTTLPDRALLRAFGAHAAGNYHRRGVSSYYTSSKLQGTSWSLILSVPTDVLYSPVSGLGQTVPWIALVMLALLALAVLWLVDRTRRDAVRLERANTDLELRNREVEEANAAKSAFLAGMSHELRTPLNGIIGFAELMHDGRVGPVSGDHREYLGDILTSARHLLELINDVLDIAKVEAGRMDFEPECVDLAQVAGTVEAALRPLADERGIRLSSDVEPGLDCVWLDPRRLRQVLINYGSNAIKFSGPGGEVRIVLRAAGEAIDVEVHDTGIGIAPEDIPTLFSEFGQLRNPYEQSGTGLGLALTKRLVEAQGGTVGVESQPGVGSIFSARIPRAAHASGGSAAEAVTA